MLASATSTIISIALTASPASSGGGPPRTAIRVTNLDHRPFRTSFKVINNPIYNPMSETAHLVAVETQGVALAILLLVSHKPRSYAKMTLRMTKTTPSVNGGDRRGSGRSSPARSTSPDIEPIASSPSRLISQWSWTARPTVHCIWALTLCAQRTAVPRSFLGCKITIRGGCCDVIMSGVPSGGK